MMGSFQVVAEFSSLGCRAGGVMMAVLLFKLRGVPEDEANEVKLLLDEHGVSYYETTAGSWGISMPGLWLHDNAGLAGAKALLDGYQQQRAAAAQAAYAEARASGTQKRLHHGIMAHPLRFLMVMLLVGFILYVTLSPFIHPG